MYGCPEVDNQCQTFDVPCETQCCDDNDLIDIPVEYIEWDNFTPYITIAGDGLEDELAAEFARLAAIEFARKTSIMQRRISIKGQACVSDYDMCHDTSLETIHRINKVIVNGIAYKPSISFNTENKNYTYCFYPSKTIVLYPAIEQDNQEIQIHYTVHPSKEACKVDSLLYNVYHSAIINGALSKILTLPAYSFSDLKTANYYRQLFLADIRNAIQDLTLGFSNDTMKLYRNKRLNR